MGVSIPVARTGHPFVTHLVGTAAVEERGGFLGFCLGGVEGWHGATRWGLGQSLQGQDERRGQKKAKDDGALHRR